NPLTLIMTRNRSLTATFAINTYTLTVATVDSGSVTKNPDQPTYNHGTSVQLTGVPRTGYHFVSWSGDTTSAANPITLTMTADKHVTANFTINTYPLNVSIVGTGTVVKSPDQPTYNHGTSVQLTATPGVGFHFVAWSGDASSAANPITLVMTSAKNVTATFASNTYA